MLQILQILPRNLRNTLLCKINKYFGNKDYPDSVLPKVFYKQNIDINALVKSTNTYLVRRSDLNAEDTFEILKKGKVHLKTNAIISSDVQGLSSNILGGKFKPEYIKYRILPRTEGLKKWIPKTEIYLSEHFKEYEIKEGCGIYFNIKAIHKEWLSYKLPASGNPDKSVTNFFDKMEIKPNIIKDTEGKTFIKLPGKIIVTHDPLNLNYWHSEIILENFAGEVVNNGSSWSKDLCLSALTNILTVNASNAPNGLEEIESKFYHLH